VKKKVSFTGGKKVTRTKGDPGEVAGGKVQWDRKAWRGRRKKTPVETSEGGKAQKTGGTISGPPHDVGLTLQFR